MLQALPPRDILGRCGADFDRLIGQAWLFDDLTAQVLQAAGLGEGMRVLDVGCGAGDVSFLAARLVGSTGAVVGVDKAPEAVALARKRAATVGLMNVRFLTRDLADLTSNEPVDALIGRLVLMHVSDPAVVVRRLAGFVRPGGIVAFQEFDLDGAKSEPSCPVFDRAVARLKQTFTRAGIDSRTGLKLGRIFQEAGLPAPRMILGAHIERGMDSPLYDHVAQLTAILLPLMERTGVASAGEVGIETLAARLREEAVALDATVVSPSFIGAWTRTSTKWS